ncbi:MAG TPA: tetratricopeptide repeat protein, partial [Thermoanaerobaculia bacterium]|nr:tetratricopeptide repeat protein [Thermoanaerobaculia bacterium]
RRICSETFYPRLHFGWSDLASIVDARHHLIDGPAPELYDLAADPRERVNVLAERRSVYHDLRRELDGCRAELVAPAAVDEETRRAMAALGYLGSAGDAGGGPLPDPKSQLPALADLKRGFQQMHEKRWAEAEKTFGGLVAGNPQMIDAWEFLGRARLKLGRPEQALTAYQEALRRASGNPQTAVQVASILFDLGRLDDAAAHARLAMAGSASFAHGLLARIAVRRGDLEGAEREARAALGEGGQRVGPLVVLAEVLLARGDPRGALDAARQAREVHAGRAEPDVDLLRGLGVVEGKVHADLGDAAAAERAFRGELRSFPDEIGAYSNLALLQALTGRQREALGTLRLLTEMVPTAAAYAEVVRTYRALRDERGAGVVLNHARAKFPESEELRRLAGS